MTHLQAEVILALADNGLRISKAARETYRHHNTFRYHIAEIKKEIGLNPLDFWDMQKLVPMAKDTLLAEVYRKKAIAEGVWEVTPHGDS